MLDSDDEWLGNHIEKKIETLITKKADGVFGSAMVNNGTELIDKISRPIHKNETFVNYILSDGIAQTSSHFYKSECAKNILWSNELLRHQDYDYCVKFAKQYNFVPCYEITTIIHWTTGVRRNEHIDSMIRFIKSNKQDISLSNYINYHKLYHSHFKNRKDISHEHKNYFKTEILKNISSISLNDFMSLHDGNLNFIKRLFLRLEFIWRILLK